VEGPTRERAIKPIESVNFVVTHVGHWAGIVRRIADIEYRLHDRLRPPAAFDATREPVFTDDLRVLRNTSTCLLVTYRRNGEPVPTPVLFGVANEKIYFRAESRTAKVRRIRTTSRVLVAPCSFRGAPTGPFIQGIARIVSAEEEPAAYTALRRNYRWIDRLYESAADRLPVEPAYVEVMPTH
jgi:PPOX class probable F420-dependent enzyme